MPDANSLDVVIVAYRCRDLLRRCLDALLANPPERPMTVTVVDNDSPDESLEAIADLPVRAIQSGRNAGFGAGCNIGAAAPMRPMPAETLRQSTAQISQNCVVLWASFRSTWPVVIMAWALADGVQPSGFHPAGGSL